MKRAAISFGLLSILLVTLDPFGLLLLVLSDEENISVDLKTWEAPREIQKQFPYYISGLDKKGLPVFVVEVGKWDLRKYFEDGGDEKIANLHIDQMYHRFSQAHLNFGNVTADQSGRYVILIDYDGFQAKQLTYGPSMYFLLTMAKKFLHGPGKQLDYATVVNAGPTSEVFINNLLFPLLGNNAKKIKVTGINSETWIPLLLEKIPKESLAPWYGGSLAPFRPLAIYG